MDELKEFDLNITIILEKSDIETIKAISNYKCEIIYQVNKGYGDALILGLNSVQTKYFCIFNADGSFNPNELNQMINKIENDKNDIVFASRYEENCSSEDDTIITYLEISFYKIRKFVFQTKYL